MSRLFPHGPVLGLPPRWQPVSPPISAQMETLPPSSPSPGLLMLRETVIHSTADMELSCLPDTQAVCGAQQWQSFLLVSFSRSCQPRKGPGKGTFCWAFPLGLKLQSQSLSLITSRYLNVGCGFQHFHDANGGQACESFNHRERKRLT